LEEYLLYGSGGHAKVVLECLRSENKSTIGFFDDDSSIFFFKNIKVLGKYDPKRHQDVKVIVTIGNNKTRKAIVEKIKHSFGTSIHRSTLISPDATIGKGSMILHRAIIQSDAKIGNHTIINTMAVVEHDCVIEDFVHVAPGAVVCGNVQIGEGTLVGANAVIAPNLKIGKWCQISAGSAVFEDVPDNTVVK
jgi:sugar O-acyltransferase (sialic acid O-acetyltransferase NeuD family)